MNKLTTVERAQILIALVEGNSMASASRMFGVSKITILRLLADAGTLAAQYHDLTVCELASKRVQCDEIWNFCYAKEKNVPTEMKGQFGFGDVWTWTAIDADSKLMVSYLVARRDQESANQFMRDLAGRLRERIQLTTDGHHCYWNAAANAFRDEVDYAQLIKIYGPDLGGQGKYSPAECTGCKIKPRMGNPDLDHVSTSYVERQNLTMRMSMRRATRLTNGFSKNVDNHKHAVALHYFHYNFIRKHQTIKMTPAMAAGIADKAWTMVDFVMMLEREEELLGGRLTDYKPAASKKSH